MTWRSSAVDCHRAGASRLIRPISPDRALLDAETHRQRLIGQLVQVRKDNGLKQAAVAKSMNVGQSVIAEIESAKADIRFSTLDRYAEAVSRRRLRLELVRS